MRLSLNKGSPEKNFKKKVDQINQFLHDFPATKMLKLLQCYERISKPYYQVKHVDMFGDKMIIRRKTKKDAKTLAKVLTEFAGGKSKITYKQ